MTDKQKLEAIKAEMSKIAEQKALEAYPIKEEWVGNQYGGLEDINSLSREKYQQGYDQAMQDFFEKAEKFFNEGLFTRFNGKEYRVASKKCMNLQQFIGYFKQAMQEREK